MFLGKILVLTLVLYLVLNFAKLKQGNFSAHDLILPFSLSLAVAIVDTLLKAAFVTSLFAFVALFVMCFGLLKLVTFYKK